MGSCRSYGREKLNDSAVGTTELLARWWWWKNRARGRIGGTTFLDKQDGRDPLLDDGGVSSTMLPARRMSLHVCVVVPGGGRAEAKVSDDGGLLTPATWCCPPHTRVWTRQCNLNFLKFSGIQTWISQYQNCLLIYPLQFWLQQHSLEIDESKDLDLQTCSHLLPNCSSSERSV